MRSILLALLLLATAIQADDSWDREQVWRDTSAPASSHSWQITLGLAYRTDQEQSIDQDLTPELGVIKFLTPALGLAARASWTSHARTIRVGVNQDVSIFSGNLSLRVQDQSLRVSPFGELGYDLKRYTGELIPGRGWKSNNGGLSIGGGVAIRLNSQYAIDLSFRQVQNHLEFVEPLYAPIPPIGPDGYIPYSLSQNFYNPTHIQLHFRIGL